MKSRESVVRANQENDPAITFNPPKDSICVKFSRISDIAVRSPWTNNP
jgi:hypothetical protein